MQTDHLHYILEVARQGSINKAAEALRFPRPHLSRILSNYEQELGYPLFERLPRGVRPTPEGKYVLSRIEEALAILDELSTHFREPLPTIFPKYHDTITFFCPVFMRSRGQISQILEKFQSRYPNIYLIQKALHHPHVNEPLLRTPNSLGFALYSESIDYMNWQPVPPLQFFPFLEMPLVALVGANHPLAANKSLSLKTLCREQLVLISRTDEEGPLFKNLLSHYGTPNIKRVVTGNISLLQELVAAGHYLSLGISSPMIGDGLIAIPLKEKILISAGLLLDTSQLSSVPMHALAELLLTMEGASHRLEEVIPDLPQIY